MRSLYLILFISGLLSSLSAQEDTPRNWSLNGYIKDLQSANIVDGVDQLLQDNLLHNRLNFRWYISERWNFRADLRSRVFWGDVVRLTPNYLDQVNAGSDVFFDLSLGVSSDKGLVLHSTLDRFYVEWIPGQWEIRLGRQRINWGINTIWNPNDIFNAYAFSDFDYEERPGADALRVQYYSGVASSIELAVGAFDDWEEVVAAGLLRLNRWNYDFQVLAGIMQRHLVGGGGWAGSLGNAGFKGEWTYFHALDEEDPNSVTATFAIDYSFKKGLYLNGGLLYNSLGSTSAPITELFNTELSARNLYPYRWSILVQGAYPITPLFNSGLAIIYSPSSVHTLFVNPTLSYSIQQNWDLDLVGQMAFSESPHYKALIQALFLRLKWSF
ncbi:MAG: hypothetical protein AAGG75_00390 [Bacteroidota bacterium]